MELLIEAAINFILGFSITFIVAYAILLIVYYWNEKRGD
jgi:hypothetical protein